MRKLLTRRAWFAAAALVLATAAAGTAYATGLIGADTAQPVAVCVNNSSGALRVVSDSSQCTKKEHSVLLQQAVAAQPTEFTVDCGAGQKIGDVLASLAPSAAPVSIHVKGTCTETVRIMRDDVSIDGQTSDAGIQAPTGAPAVVIDGAQRVQLEALSLAGDANGEGISAGGGAAFHAWHLHMGGFGTAVDLGGGSQGSLDTVTIDGVGVGVFVDGATAQLQDSSITHLDAIGVDCSAGEVELSGVAVGPGGNMGLNATGSCFISVSGGSVQTENTGVFAIGGSIELENGTVVHDNPHAGAIAQDGGNLWVGDSVVVDHNGEGVSGYAGGHVTIQGATVENNTVYGVGLSGGSSASIDHTTIKDNHDDGLFLGDTSVALLGDWGGANSITGNGGWGIRCAPSPAVAQYRGNAGTVTGNTAGQISCP